MSKTYILDTNVLLSDPNAMEKFQEHDVVIPLVVISELDTFKKDTSEKGFAAREVSRKLDHYTSLGSLRDGVELPSGGTLRIGFKDDILAEKSNDNEIIKIALAVKLSGSDAILVSLDTNVRLKSGAVGVDSETFKSAQLKTAQVEGSYLGITELEVDHEDITNLHDGGIPNSFEGLHPNEFVHLICTECQMDGTKHTSIGRIRGTFLRPVPEKRSVFGLTPRNLGQQCAMDLLLASKIKLVPISGSAGTGKTLSALAAALKLVCDECEFTKILVSRPIFPMGKDIGFLPGTVEEKLNPWMKPIFDNLEFLLTPEKSSKTKSNTGRAAAKGKSKDPHGRATQGPPYQYLIDTGLLGVEPLTYIRGRSIPNQFMIIDEAQNLTPHEVKTILTRVGEGTKIILTGDPNQIDNPYIDGLSNGLSHVIEAFKDEEIAGHITLSEGERSALATLAAEIL